jgi:hypothetical protein
VSGGEACGEECVADFADGAVAGEGGGAGVGGVEELRARGGWGDGEARVGVGGEVREVVPHVGAAGGGELEVLEEAGEAGALVQDGGVDVLEAELVGAGGGDAFGAACDHGELEARLVEHGEAVPVDDAEALGLVAEGVDPDGAVGEDAVAVQDEEVDEGELRGGECGDERGGAFGVGEEGGGGGVCGGEGGVHVGAPAGCPGGRYRRSRRGSRAGVCFQSGRGAVDECL